MHTGQSSGGIPGLRAAGAAGRAVWEGGPIHFEGRVRAGRKGRPALGPRPAVPPPCSLPSSTRLAQASLGAGAAWRGTQLPRPPPGTCLGPHPWD